MKLSGLHIVFTGKRRLSRADRSKFASDQGAIVEERVTHRTDWLVTGNRTGKVKTEAARKKGCTVMKEIDFWNFVRQADESEPEQPKKKAKRPSVKRPEWIERLSANGGGVGF